MAMTRSTFAGFTTAQLALAASQRALDVTGNNIANINTSGYTRQRLDLASISPTGASYFMAQTDCRVGQGVQMTGLIQIRDSYLDVQYRNQLAKVGTVDAHDKILEDIGEIFDETDSTAVRAALEEVISCLQDMSEPNNANQGSSDTLVRSSIETLLSIIHEHASSLADVRTDAVNQLETADIPNINQYLDSIVELNKSIKSTQILGGEALELQDQRNSLIDELATYFPITVEYEDLNIGAGITVDTLKISLKTAEGGSYVLVDDAADPAKFTVNVDNDGKATVSVTDVEENTSEIDADTLANGVIKGTLDALNKSGGFDSPATDFNGIGYYEQLFDSVVNTLATTLNKINENAGGKQLFDTTDGSGTFTALNTKVTDDWISGNTKIITDVKNTDEDSTANVNVLKMINAINSDTYDFGAGVKGTIFTGYDTLQSTQAIDRKESDAVLTNRLTVLNEIADSKDSVSGVYMDEEVMNLMRYQQSYNAAARLMTTLDEALDTLINSTGVVGR